MSSYTADTMTPDEVIAAVLKRPALYGLVKLPDRRQVAEAIAFGLNDTTTLSDWSDDYQDEMLQAADAVLALLKGEENE